MIWLMIIPMLAKIDFAVLCKVDQYWRGIGVTPLINWSIKAFSMALLGSAVHRCAVCAACWPAGQIESYVADLIYWPPRPAPQ